MRGIAEIRNLDSLLEDPSLLPVSEKLARELETRLQAHREEFSSSQSWDSVDREVFGTE